MGKRRSRQPAEAASARRRSLVELTTALGRTIDESLLEMSANRVAVPRDDGPPSGQAAEIPAENAPRMPRTETAVQVASDVNVAMLPPAKEASHSVQFQDSNSTTTLAVEIARNMQAHALEAMKVGMHATLDYAKDLASPDSDLREGPAAECHAVALELMKVNAGATLQYARELSRAKTLSEWIELSSAHARKQCELVLQQAELLKSLTRKVTTSGAE
ncbi:phasin family protein [Bradyrhizobium sp. UNPA324]|uniref:phasin family protein n=1 Tax=Bradyrhizobium sp. UNPA324 TaxID=1141174 RepID=UPI001168B8AB|nr:phasin family protein [Bradyrhizobium sp. UNPA324]TQF32796.1 hypothetical protein UNPA324_26900 [Bradyrhizobium sp. UNPA324]